MSEATGFLILVGVIAGVWTAVGSRAKRLRPKRAEFINNYQWPSGVLDKVRQKHPALTIEDTALVSRGLKQFFVAHLMSGNKFVSMPSRVADDLWHEFILHTRDYAEFCEHAFGRFMHHTPAAAISPSSARRIDDGLRRAWWFACKDEDIHPNRAIRLPLFFTLDSTLRIPDGFRYDLDCEALRKEGDTGIHCTTDLIADRPTTNVACGG